MAPLKQPRSLFNSCVKKSICLINCACYVIEKKYSVSECDKEALTLKRYLMSLLPARLFDVLCSERTCCVYRGDPCIQLQVLTHPNMAVFCKSDFDNDIPQHFWIDTLSKSTHLVILDLKFICTDEILEVISSNCQLLEQINIVSRVDICKSIFNASVLIRNVSDVGLCYVAKLKFLRILSMDPPRNERANRIGRCVSQAGIILVINELPLLEELRIETCDIGSTLISTVMDIGPLNLRKINFYFATPEGITKLIQICPRLRSLSITAREKLKTDAILDQISNSDLCLNKLDLNFFSYSDSMRRFLTVKGSYLTHFSLWEIGFSLNLDAVLSLGYCCPNLKTLGLMTQSRSFVLPRDFQSSKNIFSELRTLSVGSVNFDINNVLTFFLKCTNVLQKLVIKYQTKTNIDETLLQILQKGYFKNLDCLWLDCTLEVSTNVALKVIQQCDKLQLLTLERTEDMNSMHLYIQDNNLDIKLGSY